MNELNIPISAPTTETPTVSPSNSRCYIGKECRDNTDCCDGNIDLETGNIVCEYKKNKRSRSMLGWSKNNNRNDRDFEGKYGICVERVHESNSKIYRPRLIKSHRNHQKANRRK